MKLLCFQDLHAVDKNSLLRKDDPITTMGMKFQQIAYIVKKLGVKAVLNAGDTFHKKKPSENSHFLVQNVMAWFQSLEVPVLGVTGNHDITKDDLDSLEKQPVGTLYSSGTMVRMEPLGLKGITYDEEKFTVLIVGLDFRRDLNDLRRWLVELNQIPKAVNGKPLFVVCIIHCYAVPGGPGKMFDDDAIGYEELAITRPDVFVLGHDHASYGVIDLGNGKICMRPGAPFRGTISREDIQRIPAVGIIDITETGVSGQTITLKCAPAGDVFDFKLKQEMREEKAAENAFVVALNSTVVDEDISLWGWLDSKVPEPEVKQKIIDLLAEQDVRREEPASDLA